MALEITAVRIPLPIRQMLAASAASRLTPQGFALRCRIILDLEQTQSLSQTARTCGVAKDTVWRWRNRWQRNQDTLASLPDEEVPSRLAVLLADAPRPGAEPTFSPEQVASIIAMACEAAVVDGTAVGQWSHVTLAEEAVRRGVVPSVSPSSVGRFLKSGRTQTA